MIDQAVSITHQGNGYRNITYREASAESLPFLVDEEVDMVVAGQAAHWFDLPRLWPEMNRIVRKGGTLAFWGYKDHVFVDYPRATDILNQYSYGKGKDRLGDYWPEPGRSIVQNKLRDIQPPHETWEDIRRIEYEPRARGPRSGEGHLLLERRMKLGDVEEYVRTWSSVHNWLQDHPEAKRAKEGGMGDVVDEMFERMVEEEEEWKQAKSSWKEKYVDIEWGSGVLLARKR
jgi:SAM-dependent methyltransferase